MLFAKLILIQVIRSRYIKSHQMTAIALTKKILDQLMGHMDHGKFISVSERGWVLTITIY